MNSTLASEQHSERRSPFENLQTDILFGLNLQLDLTSSIRPNQNDPMDPRTPGLQSLKTNSSMQYLFSIIYDLHSTTKHTEQHPQTMSLEFACARYWSSTIFKTILKIPNANYWDISYPIWQACRAQLYQMETNRLEF